MFEAADGQILVI